MQILTGIVFFRRDELSMDPECQNENWPVVDMSRMLLDTSSILVMSLNFTIDQNSPRYGLSLDLCNSWNGPTDLVGLDAMHAIFCFFGDLFLEHPITKGIEVSWCV